MTLVMVKHDEIQIMVNHDEIQIMVCKITPTIETKL